MRELLAYSGMALAAVSAIAGQVTLGQAREHIKAHWPKLFEELSDYGLPVLRNMSSADNKVRRALARNLLLGSIPAEVRADPRMAELTLRWRVALLGIVAGFGLLIVAVR